MDSIVAIDLGTSTSEIAILKDGKPFVITNHLGEYITPSVVGLSNEGRIIVGKEARDQLLLKPDDTVVEVKRLMGSGQTVSMGGKNTLHSRSLLIFCHISLIAPASIQVKTLTGRL